MVFGQMGHILYDVSLIRKMGRIVGWIIFPEMQKAASMASALVLFFSTNCANFWPVYAQNLLNSNAVLC